MTKKIMLGSFLFLLLSYGLFSFEVGLTVGTITNPSRVNYGLSGGMGFLIPMVKFEVEFYKKSNVGLTELPNTITGGIKFRPKFGRFAPYAIIGLGTEFETLSFDFDIYEEFTFIGGGLHLYIAGMVSLRADVRFLNYSGFNRTRLSAGLFFHF